MSTKRRRLHSSTPSNWSNLPPDILDSVLKRLSYIDMFSFKYVCSSWKSFANSLLMTPSSPSPIQSPFLVFPTDYQEHFFDDYDDKNNNVGGCFFNLAEQKFGHEFKNLWGCYSTRLVGSSHGWIIVFDEEKRSLFLFNPFHIEVRKIDLPPFVSANITKAILTSDPICCGNKFGVVLIHGVYPRIACFINADNITSSIDLHGSSRCECADITCTRDYLFGLSDFGVVNVWKLRDGLVDPRSKWRVEFPLQEKVLECSENLRDYYTTRLYLVESRGDLLLVVRCVAEFVREDGKLLRNELELVDDRAYSHTICTYMTRNLYVYKLYVDGKQWLKVKSLGDHALFLGGNQSLCLSSKDFCEFFEGNSIYFTDDYLLRVNEHHMYGGHDMGVFNLKDRSIKQVFPSELKKFYPPPFWIFSNLKVDGYMKTR